MKITVICTRHQEIGNCNSYELYKIFESLRPDLIFEEIPPSYFDKYYTDMELKSLETTAIHSYSNSNNIKHILVDSDDIPPESFFNNYYSLLRRIEGMTDVNGFNYRNFIDNNRILIATQGFFYLNSDYSIRVNDEICDAIEKGLGKICNDELNQTNQLWKDTNDRRENEMLNNIYEYSKIHKYDNAIFTIGIGHRKSLMNKVISFNEKSSIDINWAFLTFN
jgi:hypothetical protein